MSILNLLLGAIGAFILLRGLLLLFFAEVGRKQDLIKHIYKGGNDFQIAVIIPYLDSRKIAPFQDLLDALIRQDYPNQRIGIHVAATEETIFGLPSQEDLPHNTKVWTYPAQHATSGEVTSWLIERLLAAGGPSRLFVFLDPDDIVRPDFLKNVTSRAFDCFAMQGYIALKRPPRGIFSSVLALSSRLINRIENAGRFHMGQSCRLMSSGWVVRQELLEMIAYQQGQDIDNLEYTVQLNLNGYRVNWAPNVVVYKEENVELASLMKNNIKAVLNRLRLIPRYSLQLLLQMVTRGDLNAIEQIWSLFKPPAFILGAVSVAFTLLSHGRMLYYWAAFAGVFVGIQLVSLLVARCRFKDFMSAALLTPTAYVIGLVSLPFFLVNVLADGLLHIGRRPQKIRIGRRFDESKPTIASNELAEIKSIRSKRSKHQNHRNDVFDLEHEEDLHHQPVSSESFATIYDEQLNQSALEGESFLSEVANEDLNVPKLFRETHLPISNGKNSVECKISTYIQHTESGENTYHLVFEYKNLSFKTQSYHILDQAFYELHTKLKGRGFSIVSCGSCAYFYRPTVGNAYGFAKANGFCLYGKEGQDIHFDTDAVGVLTEACQNHEDMAYRQEVLTHWQDSLKEYSVS